MCRGVADGRKCKWIPKKTLVEYKKKTKKTYLGLEMYLHLEPQSSSSLLSCGYRSLLLYTYPSNTISKAITLKKKHTRVVVVVSGWLSSSWVVVIVVVIVVVVVVVVVAVVVVVVVMCDGGGDDVGDVAACSGIEAQMLASSSR